MGRATGRAIQIVPKTDRGFREVSFSFALMIVHPCRATNRSRGQRAVKFYRDVIGLHSSSSRPAGASLPPVRPGLALHPASRRTLAGGSLCDCPHQRVPLDSPEQLESQYWSHNYFALRTYRAADVNDATRAAD